MHDIGVDLFYLFLIYWAVVYLKSVRDIIQFSYRTSIFTKFPKIIQDFLLDKIRDRYPWWPKVLDGWHSADGLYLIIPLGIIFLLLNHYRWHEEWYSVVLAFVIFIILIYQIFNIFYHDLNRLSGHGGQISRKQFREDYRRFLRNKENR